MVILVGPGLPVSLSDLGLDGQFTTDMQAVVNGVCVHSAELNYLPSLKQGAWTIWSRAEQICSSELLAAMALLKCGIKFRLEGTCDHISISLGL